MNLETKNLLVKMVETWNSFHLSHRVDAEFEEDEFSKGKWAIAILLRGVVDAEFMYFLLPALSCNNCLWFLSEADGRIYFHIQ